MKLISILVALLLVGYLAQKQLASTSANTAKQEAFSNQGVSVPNVPTSLKDVKQLEVDMNMLMQGVADKRAKVLEESLSH